MYSSNKNLIKSYSNRKISGKFNKNYNFHMLIIKNNKTNKKKIINNNSAKIKYKESSTNENNKYKTNGIKLEELPVKYNQSPEVKYKTYYGNQFGHKILLSQGNSFSSSNLIKPKYNSNLYNSNINKNFIITNKYSPGYIYYKEYKTILKKLKLNQNKTKSAKVLEFQKKGINEPKKRYKSENARNINKNYNLNRYNNIYYSRCHNINDKYNPYSIYWANKLLNKHNAYIGINFSSSVPLLKSFIIKKKRKRIFKCQKKEKYQKFNYVKGQK